MVINSTNYQQNKQPLLKSTHTREKITMTYVIANPDPYCLHCKLYPLVFSESSHYHHLFIINNYNKILSIHMERNFKQ